MTMAPGTTVTIQSAAAPSAIPADLGNFFVAGQASSGPVGTAVLCHSLADYTDMFGNRTDTTTSSLLYDAVDTYFQEGGSSAYVSRVFPAASVTTDTATLTLTDQAATPLPTLTVTANGPGLFGNNITVAVTVTGSTYIITVTCPGYPTEVSPVLSQPADAANWATNYSDLVNITQITDATAPPANNPRNIAATHLTGGANATGAPVTTDWLNALNVFVSDLGMGQVAAPGQTVAAVWGLLLNHAQTYNRFAILDTENVSVAGSMVSDAASALAAANDGSYGIMVGPWVLYPGLPSNTQVPPYQRVVPPSGAIAGIMARLAGQANNGDTAAAGQNGLLTHASGVNAFFVDSDRATLDANGVSVVRNYRGQVQLYGYNTLTTDPNWHDAGNARLRMQIIDGVRAIGDGFMFADIDAAGHTASAFGGMIDAYLTALYHQGALYGATPQDAFFTNVSSTINTDATAQARQLLASIGVRMSPTAEFVIITVTKYPVTEALPS